MILKIYDTFLNLVRLGIGHSTSIPEVVDWTTIGTFAERQGLSAILVDSVDRLPKEKRPPLELMLQWVGFSLQNYEHRYEQYKRAIVDLAKFYNSHGYKMMVLKGYACSLDWQKPEHRPCGDIDIWQFGEQKEADEVLVRKKGIKIDNTHHQHTVFEWQGFIVENHYDFVNVYAHKTNRELEAILKELGQDNSHFVELYGERVYLPSPNLHALFLIRHMVAHFAGAEISLRQVLDWAFFVKKHTTEVDWKWLVGLLEKFRMKDFFNCINAICVEDLGFSPSIFPSVQYLPSMKERVLTDILLPKYATETPHGLLNRLIYKFRRWQGNAWKQKMCYNESRWCTFLYGIWAKMLKPASI